METKKSLKNRKPSKNLNEVTDLSESEKCFTNKSLKNSQREVVCNSIVLFIFTLYYIYESSSYI